MAVEHPRPEPRVEPDAAAREASIHGAVAERGGSSEPPTLPFTCGGHARADCLGALLAGLVRDELERARRLELAHQVDPVEQRAAQPPLISGPGLPLTFAQPLRPRTWARVAGADEHHRG